MSGLTHGQDVRVRLLFVSERALLSKDAFRESGKCLGV